MLKIKDKDGKTKFILMDDDEECISIDELILREIKSKVDKKKTEKEDAN